MTLADWETNSMINISNQSQIQLKICSKCRTPKNIGDFHKDRQFLKACHYTNLQPLWAKDNIRKGAKVESVS